MIYIAEPPRSQVQVDSCNGLTCGLSLAASGGPSQSNVMEVGGNGPAKRIKDDLLRCIAVGASSSCAGPADHPSARRDVILVLGCKESTLVRGRCGLYLADVWRVMSIAVHRHSTTRGAGYTSPISHGRCVIHRGEETTGEASPPISCAIAGVSYTSELNLYLLRHVHFGDFGDCVGGGVWDPLVPLGSSAFISSCKY